MVFASLSKRCLCTGSLQNWAGRILMATVRSSRVSRARYTSPIPPAPSGARISWGPSRVAGASAMIGCDYTPGEIHPCSILRCCGQERAAWHFYWRTTRQLPNCDQLGSDLHRGELLEGMERPTRIELALKPWQG